MRLTVEFTVYATGADRPGRILRSGQITCDQAIVGKMIEAQAQEPDTAVVLGLADAERDGIVDGVVVPRPLMALSPTTATIAADGVAAVLITGIPAGAVVTVRDRRTVVEDGELVFTSDLAGRYELKFQAWPWRDGTVVVEAV